MIFLILILILLLIIIIKTKYIEIVCIKSSKYIPQFVTTNICSKWGEKKSNHIKKAFVKFYKIDWTKALLCNGVDNIDICVSKFETLNDLFERKILPKYTIPESSAINDIISPAECMVRHSMGNMNFNIKNVKYNLYTLLNLSNNNSNEINTQKTNIFIFRLAPSNYHRFHSPTKSKILYIKNVNGTYQSVNPILLESCPVLQENIRTIIKFENGIYMVMIGATCVGSIKLSVKNGDMVEHGQDIGCFNFGGSCIVLVIPIPFKQSKNITINEKPLNPCILIGRLEI